jgi:hypothetical protein
MSANYEALAQQAAAGKGTALKETMEPIAAFEERMSVLRQIRMLNEKIRDTKPEHPNVELNIYLIKTPDADEIHIELCKDPGWFEANVMYKEILAIKLDGETERTTEYKDY